MSDNGHPPSCSGCIPCEEPDCGVAAYCIDEHPTGNLCDHHYAPICTAHWPGRCPDCIREAELEMYATGDYNPAADPMLNHRAPTWVEPINPYYDATTNTYRFPRSTA